ncbi:heavy metal translocating P-type ATPase [Helicobacter sp. 23-1045]
MLKPKPCSCCDFRVECEDSANFSTKRELAFLLTLIAIFLGAVATLHFTQIEALKYGAIIILVAIYLISGKEIFINAFANFKKGDFFDENALMFIATIAAFAIEAYEEAVAVMLFFRTGEFFQEMALNNSKKSIKSLLQIAPNIAHLKRESKIIDIAPKDLQKDDIFIVYPGEKIPLDGIVIDGESTIDTKALTGEPIPVLAKKDSKILGGTLNLNGVLEVRALRLYVDSSVAKIIDLVQNATQNKAKAESFITKFARTYTPIVFFFALCVAIVPPLLGFGTFNDWIYRALVVLMVSCPCALVISVPLAYFGGIGAASKNAILIKGANYLEALSEVSHIAFDKTGTLTKGVFKIIKIEAQNGFSEDEVLQYAFCAENFSNHPIALAIKAEYEKRVNSHTISHSCTHTTHENISGMGIKATCNYQNILAGNDKILHKFNVAHDNCEIQGTVAHIAVNDKYAGYIMIADELKDDSVRAVRELRDLGVEKMAMLTGDNEFATKEISASLGLDEVHYNLLPEEKARIFGEFSRDTHDSKGKSVFVGDGINDAPSIACADIGISMGGVGSDVSKESADILIVDDSLSKIATAIKIARKTKRIIWQNIGFALGVKVVFIVLGLFGVANIWEAVFGDVGVALIALSNAMRILKV